ncbi:hypothetical protein G7046_g5555 [Stylonectria norvegica]|nr:hypothetical protein G7046_g5555 [Stylonectria norvegica]
MRPSTFLCTLAISLLSAPQLVSAEAPPYENDRAYDEGKYGDYPAQQYQSSDALAPRLNLLKQSPKCDRELFTFLSPRGRDREVENKNARAVILDPKGALVWGNDYLTFWAGDNTVKGHGAGYYYMLDRTYNLTRNIGAANGLDGDLHEFLITDQGTAMITIYKVVDYDLSSHNTPISSIWDSIVQEIDIETGAVIFEWYASQHIKVSDSYRPIKDDPWDWFHINSIEKDEDGNYIISSRYTHAIYKIDGKTGDIIWILGGKGNSFYDLSEGKATNFAFQHDARWHNNFTELTLFDNTDDGYNDGLANPRGLRLRVDQAAMTVSVITEYKNPSRFPASSQGSVQDLENGNVLVGYGYASAYTEFSHDGAVLCDTHFGPQTQFGNGSIQSYRVYKLPWKGMPTADPDLVVAQDNAGIWRAYFSWNGATEVAEWVLQGSDDPDNEENHPWRVLGIRPPTGFETAMMLGADHPKYIRVVALDSMANVLGTTRAVDATKDVVNYPTGEPGTPRSIFSQMALWKWAAILGVVGCLIYYGHRPAMRAWRKFQAGNYQAVSEEEGLIGGGRQD